MSTDELGRRQRVIELVAEILEIDDPGTIQGSDRLREDLGMDSLFSLELLSSLGEELHIDLDMEDAMEISTIDDACAFVERNWEAQRGVEASSA